MFTAPIGEPPAFVQHVASNGIWDPNKLYNPPVITTTGVDSVSYPVRWYDMNGNEIAVLPQPQPLPIVNIPWIPPPQQTHDLSELMRLLQEQVVKSMGVPKEMLEGKKVEEPEEEAKPVEKKYVRVLEP